METINMIRLILGCGFVGFGLLLFFMEVFCVHKLRYILNRMHFAGSGDTMALAAVIVGSVIINGFSYSSFKLILVLVFFWFASPVSSHLISRLVAATDEDMEKHVKVCSEEESKKLIEGED